MKSDLAYVEHVLHCIGRIREDARGGREAVFGAATLQDAIVRNLQVMCESTQRLSQGCKDRHPEVDWKGIAGLRNVLVHAYFDVDFETIWAIVSQDLGALEAAATALKANLSVSPPQE